VYDSFYGNTKQVALAIGDSLASFGSCDTLHVDEITPEHLKGIDILIVGSPTRAFRPTKSISSLLDGIPQGALKAVTNAESKGFGGYEFSMLRAKSLYGLGKFDEALTTLEKLVKKGGTLIAEPEGFFVEGLEGPLKDNELQRASAWVESVLKT